MDIKLNYHSLRSDKARVGFRLDGIIRALLVVAFWVFILGGIFLIMFNYYFGWALIGLSAFPAMIVEWYNGELKNLKTSKDPKRLDDIIEGNVLGRLSRQPSPAEVASVIATVYGGQFFAVRLGISSRFIQESSSKDSADMAAVWQEAINVKEQAGSPTISAAVLAAALVKNIPNYRAIIGRLQLDDQDLIEGVKWYDHLSRLIDNSKKHHKTGGIARDWSFGWTPLLDRFSTNISRQISGDSLLLEMSVHGETIDSLVEVLDNGGRRNATLVGPAGVGKTQVVKALSARLMDGSANLPSGLRFNQVFMLDSAALIAAAPGRGEIENLVPAILNEAYKAKNTIVCLDNAELFFGEEVGAVDLSNVLMPILEGGALRLILTMDEQNYLRIEQRQPQLAKSLNRIAVAESSESETIAIMRDQAINVEFEQKVTFMHQALKESYKLAKRYVHDLAMPGQALKLFESAARYDDNGLVTMKSVQEAIEKTLDVKVGIADNGEEREKLLNLEDLLHERMINQTRAVSAVSDALRRARAGVRNQNRPIGTFLFLGPTGVGKSELAKALAAIYFKGEDNIIRVDLNEYVTGGDVARLIADGSEDPSSLTAQVMKRPFSVILLDEIEKAHPSVLATLLQMLDEGILRDVKNREVSFRDAIIIATSNAGADRIREYIERGHDIAKFEKQFIDELISSNQFRPEFLNRFDEIAVFRPLNRDELLQVVDLILKEVNKTLEAQKVSVVVASDAKAYLVEKGYDPRLGARPMRRVVQKAVENTVAKKVLGGEAEAGGVIEISLGEVQTILDTKLEADSIVQGAE